MHIASQSGHLEIVQILIAKGAKIDTNDISGNTSLHLATSYGQKQCLELLIQKGANIESRNSSGYTPLHSAASVGQNQTLDILIQNGANIESQNNVGRTPLHIAVENWSSYYGSSKNTVETLIQNGAKLEAKDIHGQTQIQLAICRKQSSMVQILLRYGASLKMRNEDGFNPLEVALILDVFSWNHEKKMNLIKFLTYSGMM